MQNVRAVATVLLLVGAVLALVDGLRPLLRGFRIGDLDMVLVLAAGALGLYAGFTGSQGKQRDAGVLGVVGGVLALLAGSDLAGALLLIGGALNLVK